jgi:hypothetical protein
MLKNITTSFFEEMKSSWLKMKGHRAVSSILTTKSVDKETPVIVHYGNARAQQLESNHAEKEINDMQSQKILNPLCGGYDQTTTSFNDFNQNVVHNDKALDMFLENEFMALQMVHPVLEHEDEGLDLST